MLTDVSSTDWFATMTVSHAEGTARIDYPALQAVAGAPLTYVGNGRLQIVQTATIVGREVKAEITGRPELDAEAQTITLTDPEITVAGVELPGFTADALLRALLKPIPVTGDPARPAAQLHRPAGRRALRRRGRRQHPDHPLTAHAPESATRVSPLTACRPSQARLG